MSEVVKSTLCWVLDELPEPRAQFRELNERKR